MMILNISSLMKIIKERYEKSKDKSSWRVLHGMHRNYYDTFIAGDNNLWQIKSEEVSPGEFIAVGSRISSFDDELGKIMKSGSQVPFGSITPVSKELSIIMAGIQTYSSDSSSLLCKEYFSSKQVALEEKLRSQVNKMMDNPVFRRRYIEHKDRLRKAYI